MTERSKTLCEQYYRTGQGDSNAIKISKIRPELRVVQLVLKSCQNRDSMIWISTLPTAMEDRMMCTPNTLYGVYYRTDHSGFNVIRISEIGQELNGVDPDAILYKNK